jgi:hypothetical protein
MFTISRWIAASAASLAISAGAVVFAQMSGHEHMGMGNMNGPTTQPMGMHDMAHGDMPTMQQMRDQMNQMDQQLQAKVDAMNKAQGEAKVQAMADVINELVRQHAAMRQQHMQMMQDMMSRMGGPMMTDQPSKQPAP